MVIFIKVLECSKVCVCVFSTKWYEQKKKMGGTGEREEGQIWTGYEFPCSFILRYNHITVQKANGCSWCLGTIC